MNGTADLSPLKAMVDLLDVPFSISSVQNRIAIQKAVYLGQRFGTDLGYSYGWYLRGPYSPGLTADYYELAGTLAAETKTQYANDAVNEKLSRLAPHLKAPQETGLDSTEWLELLASLDFLVESSPQKDMESAINALRAKKPHLAQGFDTAKQVMTKIRAEFS